MDYKQKALHEIQCFIIDNHQIFDDTTIKEVVIKSERYGYFRPYVANAPRVWMVKK